MTTASFRRQATVEAQTKRPVPVDIDTGLGYEPAINIKYLKCIPLHPADNINQWRETLHLSTLVDLLQTFVADGLDVISGDRFVTLDDEKEYPIRHVQVWQLGRSDTRLLLILENLKR